MDERLESALREALTSGSATLETIVRRLASIDPMAAARGSLWVEHQLRRSPFVSVLPDGRFAIRAGSARDEVDLTEEPDQLRVRPTIDRTVAERFVVFDLETNPDRADVAEHEIIEIGACLVSGGDVADEFQVFVHPTRPLMPEVEQLTGLTEADLAEGVDLGTALMEFRAFVGDLALVAHNGFGYDFPVLEGACLRTGTEPPTGLRLDSLELAHVVFPRAGEGMTTSSDGTRPPSGRSLDALISALDIEDAGQRHRALDDAQFTVGVLFSMFRRLESDSAVSRMQRWLLESAAHPWASFVSTAGEQEPLLQDVVPDVHPWQQSLGTMTFDPAQAVAPLQPNGPLLTEGRTHREQQVAMSKAVASAFAERRPLLIEAPTGTGKTLAYLVPAVAWARATGRPVIISTHSKVLQNQVLTSITDLAPAYGEVRATLLKGRHNYISLDTLESVFDDLPSDPDEALALAVITGWVAATPTGEWDDLRTWALERRSQVFSTLRWRLCVSESPGPVTGPLEERCFYRRALKNVDKSEIAILNHAVLVSRDDWLNRASDLVLDEAHNLEEAATAALSAEVTEHSLRRLMDSIQDPSKRWGTLRRFLEATGGSIRDEKPRAVVAGLAACRNALPSFTQAILNYVRDRSGGRRDQVERYGAAYRLRPGLDTRRPDYRPVIDAARAVQDGFRQLGGALPELEVPETLRKRYKRRRLESEIARASKEAWEAARLLGEVINCRDDDEWIHIADLSLNRGRWSWGLRQVPLSVASSLRGVWDELSSVVLTSATLRVGGSFDHIIGRLGMDSAECVPLPSPFTQLTKNELLVLPDHLPAPRGGLMDEFTLAERDEVARLLTLTHGRAMVLFTSRERLEGTKEFVRPLLEEMQQIPVLAQGEEPSPALVERMRFDRTASLLATRSFWEGVDIPGEALSLLVIEKIPFDSPADPIVAARMDAVELAGGDPFTDFMVPQAVLRFVQGVGRLIRSDTDIGVIVLLDKRLRRPVPYRETFLGSLPGPPTISRPLSADEGYEAIAAHLGILLDDALWKRIRSLPTSDPWSDLESLSLSTEEVADLSLVRQRLELVRERLGFADWRDGQLEVMERVVQGKDALAVLPTGSGKSLAFQLPALLLPGLTLVICPLIALMRDQVRSLRDQKITTINAIYSGQSQAEQEEILRAARDGRYKLLYVSPERLWSQKFRQGLHGVPIARVVIDEAHCVSQWGHSFRPEYAAISGAVNELTHDGNRPTILALTATATPRVQEEIIRDLDLARDEDAVVRSPDRPELRYHVEPCVDREDRDLRVLKIAEVFRGESVIVYVPRRDDTLRLAGMLRAANHLARPYHGGMESTERIHTEEAFMDGEVDVVVATKAFGLGIDKPDVAAIVHLEMPMSVEEYIQETGRAARGAMLGSGPATGACVLLRMPRDCGIHRQFIKGAAPSLHMVKAVWDLISGGREYCTPEELAEAAGSGASRDDSVGLAVHYLITDGCLKRYEDVAWVGRVWVPGDALDVLARIDDEALHVRGIDLLEKISVMGTEDYQASAWSRILGLEIPELEGLLLELTRRDVIGFTTWRSAMHLRVVEGTEPDWPSIEERCAERKRVAERLSAEAKTYRAQDSECRRRWLLNYIGIELADPCGGCDVCEADLPRPWREVKIEREDVIEALPARAVCLALLRDLEGPRFSKLTIARALAGAEGRFELSSFLKSHGTFGRLTLLGVDGVLHELQRLVDDGLAEEITSEYESRSYASVRITEQGRHWR